jgi:glycine/D-amino acid oxidase-like deaminating enzyme
MHIAIVGAGLAGLALCWHFLEEMPCDVTLFDTPGKGASKGASWCSSGLMHPYPGEQARRSWNAQEGLAATRALLQVAEKALHRSVATSGIIRFALDEDQKNHLIQRTKTFSDIERIADREFLIHSGMTVYTQFYLEGLLKSCIERGAKYIPKKVEGLNELQNYDCVVLACGANLFSLLNVQNLPLKCIKGQQLLCRRPPELKPLEKSLIGKGHVAKTAFSDLYLIGATYERDCIDVNTCLKTAAALLIPKIAAFFPEIDQFEILRCDAGFRVFQIGSYLPLIKKISDKLWIFTALGSRGLLYHSYFAKMFLHLFKREWCIIPSS